MAKSPKEHPQGQIEVTQFLCRFVGLLLPASSESTVFPLTSRAGDANVTQRLPTLWPALFATHRPMPCEAGGRYWDALRTRRRVETRSPRFVHGPLALEEVAGSRLDGQGPATSR